MRTDQRNTYWKKKRVSEKKRKTYQTILPLGAKTKSYAKYKEYSMILTINEEDELVLEI